MKYNQIRVMMDYSAEPLWAAKDDLSFINFDIENLKLPKDIIIALKSYQDIWESAHTVSNRSNLLTVLFNDIDNALNSMAKLLAIEIKKIYPQYQLFYFCEKNSKLIEVSYT
jgi:hypothetical protein